MAAHAGVLQRIARAFAEPSDSPDLLQELMLAVWKAIPSFRGDSTPVTFIYRVAHNRALTWRARENRATHRRAAADAAWSDAMAQAAGDSDAALLERLYAAIRRLGPLDRSLILLSLEGIAYREIAVMHGISETNVGVRLNRARRRVTAYIEEDEHEL